MPDSPYVDLGGSTATSQTPTSTLGGDTYINFGQGTLDAPTDTAVTPTATSTATNATGTTPTTSNILLYVGIGIGALALLVGLIALVRK